MSYFPAGAVEPAPAFDINVLGKPPATTGTVKFTGGSGAKKEEPGFFSWLFQPAKDKLTAGPQTVKVQTTPPWVYPTVAAVAVVALVAILSKD